MGYYGWDEPEPELDLSVYDDVEVEITVLARDGLTEDERIDLKEIFSFGGLETYESKVLDGDPGCNSDDVPVPGMRWYTVCFRLGPDTWEKCSDEDGPWYDVPDSSSAWEDLEDLAAECNRGTRLEGAGHYYTYPNGPGMPVLVWNWDTH